VHGEFVDAAQAQKVAQGQTNPPPSLTKDQYNKAIKDMVYRLFAGGPSGMITCEQEQRQKPLRKMTLFIVESCRRKQHRWEIKHPMRAALVANGLA
jgi:hypothetical protein